MANLKVKVIVLAVSHLADDYRNLEFAPVDKDGNAILRNSFRQTVKGQKKNNFEEGEVYELNITSIEGDKVTGDGSGKTLPPITPTAEEIEAERIAQLEKAGKAPAPAAKTGGEGQ